jgi:hypothetical protein
MFLRFYFEKSCAFFASQKPQNGGRKTLSCFAICTKMHCYLLQNAVLTRAKRKVKCSKTQSPLLQIAPKEGKKWYKTPFLGHFLRL